MDQRSVVKGFKFVFDIDSEEVAIRFYTLFVKPKGLPKMISIDFVRFCQVAKLITLDDEIAQLAFKFYDYDNNASIGSVDI